MTEYPEVLTMMKNKILSALNAKNPGNRHNDANAEKILGRALHTGTEYREARSNLRSFEAWPGESSFKMAKLWFNTPHTHFA